MDVEAVIVLPETASLPSFFHHPAARRVSGMTLPKAALEELRRICDESFQRQLTDAELQEIGQRIVRFLKSSDEHVPDAAGDLGAF